MKENEVIFEQDFLKGRVVKTHDGEFDIEFAVLNGPSIGVTESNEFIAKTIWQGISKAYELRLKELQEEMRDAITSIEDSSEDEPSDTETHKLDKKS